MESFRREWYVDLWPLERRPPLPLLYLSSEQRGREYSPTGRPFQNIQWCTMFQADDAGWILSSELVASLSSSLSPANPDLCPSPDSSRNLGSYQRYWSKVYTRNSTCVLGSFLIKNIMFSLILSDLHVSWTQNQSLEETDFPSMLQPNKHII